MTYYISYKLDIFWLDCYQCVTLAIYVYKLLANTPKLL